MNTSPSRTPPHVEVPPTATSQYLLVQQLCLTVTEADVDQMWTRCIHDRIWTRPPFPEPGPSVLKEDRVHNGQKTVGRSGPSSSTRIMYFFGGGSSLEPQLFNHSNIHVPVSLHVSKHLHTTEQSQLVSLNLLLQVQTSTNTTELPSM